MEHAADITYPWYTEVAGDEPLAQGDFFGDCPVLIPQAVVEEDTELEADIQVYDVVAMSQSCDLQHGKLQLVLVCPVWDLAMFGKHNSRYATDKGKEELRRGDAPGYHLLNRCDVEAYERGYCVVDFRNVYGVPFDYLAAQREAPRLRLLPPYREHLAQAFARFFMRVGLPVDIPPFR